jgi:hypothetical protein
MQTKMGLSMAFSMSRTFSTPIHVTIYPRNTYQLMLLGKRTFPQQYVLPKASKPLRPSIQRLANYPL